MTEGELLEHARSPFAVETLSDPSGLVAVVEQDGTSAGEDLAGALISIPCVVIGTGGSDQDFPAWADAVADESVAPLDDLIEAIDERPVAATSLALCLREQSPSLERALIAESAVFSTLQSGGEFLAWRSARRDRNLTEETGPAVRAVRTGPTLEIILNRPGARNALNRDMRDGWLEALTLAEADPSITEVVIRGEGTNFCSGGDLFEFGTFSDPAAAHLIRLIASIGHSMTRVGERLRVEVHGHCAGSGVELASFAPLVVARPDFTASLPEVSMGLIPGAGGTVSITRRIGRHRMALLALSGRTIDAATALNWGLVDQVADQ